MASEANLAFKETASSTSQIPELSVDEDGYADLSDHGLTHFTQKDVKNIGDKIVALSLANNKLVAVEALVALVNLRRLDVSENCIKRLLTLLPVKDTLEALDLSNNQISSLEHFLPSFTKLTDLRIAHNKITVFPSPKELNKLVVLDLDSNLLTSLPDCRYFPSLAALRLSNNMITSIRNAEAVLPKSLEVLDISNNRLTDLTEVGYLKELKKLYSLGIDGNPCVMDVKNDFYYPIYIYSKLMTLTTIDSKDLTVDERLVGEHLHTSKKLELFYAGFANQDRLRKVLRSLIPASNPFEALTPEKSFRLVKEDYMHNLSSDDMLSPRRPVQRFQRNTPTSGSFNTSNSFTLPVYRPPKVKLTPLIDDGDGSDTDSVKSNNTVTVSLNESIRPDVNHPVVPTTTPSPPITAPSPSRLPRASSVVVTPRRCGGTPHVSTPKSCTRIVRETAMQQKCSRLPSPVNTPNMQKNISSTTYSVRGTPAKLNRADDMSTDVSASSSVRTSMPKVIAKPPLKPLFDDSTMPMDSNCPSVGTLEKAFDERDLSEKMVLSEFDSTKEGFLSDSARMDRLREAMKSVASAKDESNQQVNLQAVMTSVQEIIASQKEIKARLSALEQSIGQKSSSEMQMFVPMPTNIRTTPDSDKNLITLSWDALPPVQHCVRGYAVYINDRFHTEVTAPVVRIRNPQPGHKISLEAITPTNSRSLRGEFRVPLEDREGNKENSGGEAPPSRILSSRST